VYTMILRYAAYIIRVQGMKDDRCGWMVCLKTLSLTTRIVTVRPPIPRLHDKANMKQR